MPQGTLWIEPIQRAWTNVGVTAANAKLFFYLAGTTTSVSVYSDVLLTTAYTQPIVADSNGIFAEIFLTPGTAYKVDMQTSAGVSLTGYPADNQSAIPASANTVDTTETAGEALTAGQGAYLSDGSGGKNAGQLYKWDSTNTYSSTTPTIGMVPAAVAAGATVSFRTSGQMTGLAGLTPGTDYYASTAGTITSTAPANTRFVGKADSATSIIITGNPKPANSVFAGVQLDTSVISLSALLSGVCQGRLTLTSGTPVTTADVTAATSVFFAPISGNNVGVYDGVSRWTVFPFTQLTLALGTLTSGLPYDVYLYNNAGVLTLEALAWTNGTTRATALTTQDGILVKTGATTRRYLGTFYTTSTTTTEDSLLKRNLFNYYNPRFRTLQRFETTASWVYSTATVRQANGSAANQVEVMYGWPEQPIDLTIEAQVSTAGSTVASVGIGENSTTTYVAGMANSAINASDAFVARMVRLPAVGRYLYSWNEWASGGAATTWYGITAGAGSTITPGLRGGIWA